MLLLIKSVIIIITLGQIRLTEVYFPNNLIINSFNCFNKTTKTSDSDVDEKLVLL